MTRTDLQRHFDRIRKLGQMAFIGLLLFLVAIPFFSKEAVFTAIALIGGVLCLPLVFYIVVFAIWHWKDRYRGNNSNLWGALLVIETSGWFKVIYFFRHALPDLRRRGRYAAGPP